MIVGEKFAGRATFEGIVANDYGINIHRYLDTFEDVDLVDIPYIEKKIDRLKTNLAKVGTKVDEMLKEIELGVGHFLIWIIGILSHIEDVKICNTALYHAGRAMPV